MLRQELNIRDIADISRMSSQAFFDRLTSKTPILKQMYDLIATQRGTFGTLGSSNPKSDAEEQINNLFEWLIVISKIKNTKDISKCRKQLKIGVYFLRTVLANRRIGLIRSQVIGKLKTHTDEAFRQRESSKQIVESLKPKLGQPELSKEQKSLLAQESQVAERTYEECLITGLRKSADAAGTLIVSDVFTVLAKHMGQLGRGDNTKSDIMKNPELNAFTRDFVEWWKRDHGGKLPAPDSKELYTMQSIFIACFFGNIPFQEKSVVDLMRDVNGWWKNPVVVKDSIVMNVARVVEKMGTWATEVDICELASIFGFSIKMPSINLGSSVDKPTILVENVRFGRHWITHVQKTAVANAVTIPFEEWLLLPGSAIKIKDELMHNLNGLRNFFEVKKDQKKLEIVIGLIATLNQFDSTGGEVAQKKSILEFKTQFENNLDKLMHGSDSLIMNVLIKMRDSLCKAFKIRTDTLDDQTMVNRVVGICDIRRDKIKKTR